MKRITTIEWFALATFLLACLNAAIAIMGAYLPIKIMSTGIALFMWFAYDYAGIWRSIGSKLKDQ